MASSAFLNKINGVLELYKKSTCVISCDAVMFQHKVKQATSYYHSMRYEQNQTYESLVLCGIWLLSPYSSV